MALLTALGLLLSALGLISVPLWLLLGALGSFLELGYHNVPLGFIKHVARSFEAVRGCFEYVDLRV